MPEGRMLKRAISESKKLGFLPSDSARLLYTWLIPWLDVEHRHSADPEIIKGHVFPKVKSMTIKKILKLLLELYEAKLIILYTFDGETYLQFTKSLQKIDKTREAKSTIPPPNKGQRIQTQENSGVTQNNSTQLNESKVNENKVKNENTKVFSAPNDKNRSEPIAKIEFDFEKMKWLNIKDKDLIFWKTTYPACNIKAELNKMADWLISNPKKRKKNYRRFISNWLSRTQDKGGSTTTTADEIDAWANRQAKKEKKK